MAPQESSAPLRRSKRLSQRYDPLSALPPASPTNQSSPTTPTSTSSNPHVHRRTRSTASSIHTNQSPTSPIRHHYRTRSVTARELAAALENSETSDSQKPPQEAGVGAQATRSNQETGAAIELPVRQPKPPLTILTTVEKLSKLQQRFELRTAGTDPGSPEYQAEELRLRIDGLFVGTGPPTPEDEDSDNNEKASKDDKLLSPAVAKLRGSG